MVYDLIVAHHKRNRIIAREGRVQGTSTSLEVVLAVLSLNPGLRRRFDLVIVLMVASCLGPDKSRTAVADGGRRLDVFESNISPLLEHGV